MDPANTGSSKIITIWNIIFTNICHLLYNFLSSKEESLILWFLQVCSWASWWNRVQRDQDSCWFWTPWSWQKWPEQRSTPSSPSLCTGCTNHDSIHHQAIISEFHLVKPNWFTKQQQHWIIMNWKHLFKFAFKWHSYVSQIISRVLDAGGSHACIKKWHNFFFF